MNRLLIIILTCMLLLSSKASSQPNSLPTIEAYSSINNYVLDSILYNLIYVAYVNNFENYTELNTSRCGLIEINDEIFDLSYCVVLGGMIEVSLIKPDSNYLWMGRVFNEDIESILGRIETVAESYPCSDEMTFENLLIAHTVTTVYNNYLTYIMCEIDEGRWGDDIDIVKAFNSMYDVIGIRILPIDGHDMRFEYEYFPISEEFKWTFYFDDCACWVSYTQISPSGGFINSDEDLSGVIEIN